MNCPKCKQALKPVSFAGIEVDRCVGCGGLWFDSLEDRDLLIAKGAAAALDTGNAKAGAEHDAATMAECPRGHGRMIRMVDRDQPHVWYESCSVCHGSFFDAGEFTDLSERSIGDLFKKWRKGERKLS
jgi:Zn-finger nucleic acid-binding protein